MSSRTYLSIGDVLTLLREEFPDVTISKIRFLESQGLVNPERSPSGYRKFFEADVERLRWVLRQQREHFLPLKVIRDRLADGDLSEGGEPSAVGAGPQRRRPGPTARSPHGPTPWPAPGCRGAAAPAASPGQRRRPARTAGPECKSSRRKPMTRRWRGYWPTHLAGRAACPRRRVNARRCRRCPIPVPRTRRDTPTS